MPRHRRNSTSQRWTAEIEALLPLRGRWLRYLLTLACALGAAVLWVVASQGLLALIAAPVFAVEDRAQARVPGRSRRLCRAAVALLVGRGVIYRLAFLTKGIGHRGFKPHDLDMYPPAPWVIGGFRSR
jgi:hypothetical protein